MRSNRKIGEQDRLEKMGGGGGWRPHFTDLLEIFFNLFPARAATGYSDNLCRVVA